MSTILTNGLKLPDKGSVDWYADMQNNYAILDGAVGTIANHTTQIAGKAPLVHTHGKADITDLFNSANTWSALNSYSNGQIRIKSQNQEIGVTPSSSVIQYLEFADKNDAQHGIVGLWDYTNGASEIQMYITDKFKNGAKDPTGITETTILSFGFKADGSKFLTFSGQVDNSVIPKSNNTHDLGSSSYQWNNVYAKEYYYNGTPWGLDKNNQWKETQIIHQGEAVDIVNNLSAERVGKSLYFMDASRFWAQYIPVWGTDGSFRMELGISNWTAQGAQGYWTVANKISKDFTTFDFYTTHNNANLGTSTYKWKTLNGISPGSLSFPSGGTTENTDWFDISGAIKPVGGNTTDFTGNRNDYIPPVDGWLALAVNDCSKLSVWCGSLSYGQNSISPNSTEDSLILMPVIAGKNLDIRIKGTSWYSARLIVPKGNV